MSNVIQARLINGWNLDEAAPRVGYKGKSGLWKLEEGVKKDAAYIKTLRVERILDLSLGYGVSTDFLLGLTKDPEIDRQSAERMAVMRAVHQTVQSWAYQAAQQSHHALSVSLAVKSKYDVLYPATTNLVDALNRFVELNSEQFLDMRGGAPLQNQLNALFKIISTQKIQLAKEMAATRLKADLLAEEMMGDTQLPLFKMDPLDGS